MLIDKSYYSLIFKLILHKLKYIIYDNDSIKHIEIIDVIHLFTDNNHHFYIIFLSDKNNSKKFYQLYLGLVESNHISIINKVIGTMIIYGRIYICYDPIDTSIFLKNLYKILITHGYKSDSLYIKQIEYNKPSHKVTYLLIQEQRTHVTILFNDLYYFHIFYRSSSNVVNDISNNFKISQLKKSYIVSIEGYGMYTLRINKVSIELIFLTIYKKINQSLPGCTIFKQAYHNYYQTYNLKDLNSVRTSNIDSEAFALGNLISNMHQDMIYITPNIHESLSDKITKYLNKHINLYLKSDALYYRKYLTEYHKDIKKILHVSCSKNHKIVFNNAHGNLKLHILLKGREQWYILQKIDIFNIDQNHHYNFYEFDVAVFLYSIIYNISVLEYQLSMKHNINILIDFISMIYSNFLNGYNNTLCNVLLIKLLIIHALKNIKIYGTGNNKEMNSILLNTFISILGSYKSIISI